MRFTIPPHPEKRSHSSRSLKSSSRYRGGPGRNGNYKLSSHERERAATSIRLDDDTLFGAI
jgi:hypothetical protein